MVKIQQKTSNKSFLFLYTSEHASITEWHKTVMELQLWNNTKYIRYANA